MKVTTLAMVIAFAVLAGCTQLDVFITAAEDEGTVYECRIASGDITELCYFDDAADELGEMIGATCGAPSRRWPRLANFFSLGCAYRCPARDGCNAHNGCYCP
jgi:hypothetical protein